MTTRREGERDYDAELSSTYNGLAESVLDAPIEDLEDEIRAEGSNPDEVAERVRQLLKDAIR